jgi:hypothetical protein
MAPSCRSFPIVLPTRALGLLLNLSLALACQKPEGTPPPSGNQPPERAIYSAPDAEVGEACCGGEAPDAGGADAGPVDDDGPPLCGLSFSEARAAFAPERVCQTWVYRAAAPDCADWRPCSEP